MEVPPKETVVHGMSQQCGRCGHVHREWADLRRMPVCDVCDCKQFRGRPVDDAALDAAEAADEAAFAGRSRILTGYAAQGIKQVAAGMEAEYHRRYGWQMPPVFGVLYAGVPPDAIADGGGRKAAAIIAEPMATPGALMAAAGGDPAKMIVAVAALGERKPSWFDKFRTSAGIDPADPTVAWWSITSLDIVDARTSRVQTTVREMVCVDVDERVYTVVRHRADTDAGRRAVARVGPVAVTLDTLDGYAAKARPLVEAGALEHGPVTGLPMMTEGLLRCMRLCRDEQQVRSALRGFDPGQAAG